MTVLETALVFVGIPLAIAGAIALFVYGTSSRRAPRYRPGRPYSFTPVWFLASPPHAIEPAESQPALTAGGGRAALTSGAETGYTTQHHAVRTGKAAAKGGARGTW